MRKFVGIIFDIVFIIYLEIVISFLIFNSFPAHFIYLLLFSIPAGLVLNVLTKGIFNTKVNIVLTYLFTFLITFVFGAQLVYYKIYESIISFYSITGGGQVLQFIDMIFKIIFENFFGIILLFIPLIVLIVLGIKKWIPFERNSIFITVCQLIAIIVVQTVASVTVWLSASTEIYSTKNLYYNVHAPTLTANKLGIITTMRLDLKRLVFGFEEQDIEIPVQEPVQETVVPIEKETKYNVTEIDFDKLLENETDKNIIKLHNYFKQQQPTEQNEYTGMFKGKNLVVFVCEAFSSLAIREDVTPNLYKLYNEGFQFDNFYTPIFPVSTADGEYVTDTSLIPKEGVWSISKIDGNYMPYSYANAFKQLGYSTNAYHNHTAAYYDRDKYIKAMGYDSYLAKGTGLEKRMDCSLWPNSDYEMIKVTVDDYINNDNFIAYYMTVSGHLNYTTIGNCMASRNWDEVKDLPYSAKAKAYLATQIELDKAVGELIKRLEEAGKLEDTVIALSSDHYPYGLTLDEINELSDYKRDDAFEKYHMPFLVWNSEMEEPIKVEKIGSSLDVLPTLLNLFGIEYDSRLLIGKDILSNCDPLVIFSNRSFITDKGKYNALTKKFTPSIEEEIDKDYISNISTIIYQKYQMSRLILENDYYRVLFK